MVFIFQGEWKAKMIDNPDYKGEWVHPEIDNPDYASDLELHKFDDIGALGFDLWQVCFMLFFFLFYKDLCLNFVSKFYSKIVLLCTYLSSKLCLAFFALTRPSLQPLKLPVRLQTFIANNCLWHHCLSLTIGNNSLFLFYLRLGLVPSLIMLLSPIL